MIREEIPKIDSWTQTTEDMIFTSTKNAIVLPVAKVLRAGENNEEMDFFIMNPKKCYKSPVMREHICHYLNYFEKYYDMEKELVVVLSKIKYMIDFVPEYSVDNFLYDVRVYILSPTIMQKIRNLVEYNYSLDLTYKNIADGLQYTNNHAKLMLIMSICMNCCIPLICHYAYMRRIGEIDSFIMRVFDIILHIDPTVDMYGKLYETSISNVGKSEHKNPILWGKQDIRGKDVVTHSYDSVSNIILNIMPKYTFNRSIVALNYTSIQKNTDCQVIDIEYEFSYIPLSSSKRDEDNVSDFDKFEANLVKQNEALYLQQKCNCFETMKTIEAQFGPFSVEEVNFYLNELTNDSGTPIINFQKQLVFNIFYKYFGDTISVLAINAEDYVKLMIAAKRFLKQNYMILLPYIISGRIEKLVGRKTVNKKEMAKVQASPNYPLVVAKYKNEKIIKQILSYIATIISSNFRIIDYDDKELNSRMISTMPDIVIEEVLAYSLLI